MHVVPSLVLHRLQTVVLHPAGEELMSALGHACLEHEYARGHSNAEEQVLRQLDHFAEPVVLEDAGHLLFACLLEFFIRKDERAGRMRWDAVQHVLNDVHATVLLLIRGIHEDFGDVLAADPFSGLFRSGVQLFQVGLAVLVDEHVRACEGVDLAVELDAE